MLALSDQGFNLVPGHKLWCLLRRITCHRRQACNDSTMGHSEGQNETEERIPQTTKLLERVWRTLLHPTTELSRAGCLQARDEWGSARGLNVQVKKGPISACGRIICSSIHRILSVPSAKCVPFPSSGSGGAAQLVAHLTSVKVARSPLQQRGSSYDLPRHQLEGRLQQRALVNMDFQASISYIPRPLISAITVTKGSVAAYASLCP